MEKLKLEAADPWDDLATQAPQHFEDLYTGKPAMPPTPLGRDRGETPEAILNSWVKQLKSLESQYPETITYDLSRTSKYGERGGYPPWNVMKEVLPLYASRLKSIDFRDARVADAIARTQGKLHLLQCSNHRPLDPKSALKRLLNEMEETFKQSGVKSYGNKKDPEVIARALDLAVDHPDEALALPFTLAERTQRRNPSKKQGGTRFIFMIAYALEILQKCYFYPLFDFIRSLQLRELAAYEGFEPVEDAAFTACEGSEEFVSCDFTGMDQTTGPDQTELFFMITKNFFQAKYHDMYHKVLMAGVQNPIMVKHTEQWNPGSHGTASGESFTSLKESVDNMCGHELAIILQGLEHEYQVDGDDGIAKGRDLVGYLSKAFDILGFEMNPEKQDVSGTSYHYLQRFFCPRELGKNGAYPTILALNACVYPERWHNPKHWGPRMESLRWIMILENCKHHPAFHQLIEFVRERDKYGLNLGPNPEKIYSEAKALSGFVPSYNQASKERSIDDFEVMKYLAAH